MKQKLLLPFILLFISVIFLPPTSVAQDFPDVCQQPENLLPNCNFNNSLNGWQTFIESGSVNFAVLQGGSECHAPLCPAAYMVTESQFVGGLYQQVPAQTGSAYYANLVWLTFDSFSNDPSINKVVGGIGRYIGIDPMGGTDPRSPTIVWAENQRNDCKICDNQAVTATAQADKITIFIRIDDTWRQRAAQKGFAVPPSKDQFWLDDVGLKQVGGSAAPASPTLLPTDTPPPPTITPALPSPAATPLPLVSAADAPPPPPTDAATAIAQGDSTPTSPPADPAQTPAAGGVVAPPPTLTPTNTPSVTPTLAEPPSLQPTFTPTRRPTPTPESILGAPLTFLGVTGTTVCVGGIVLGVFVLVVIGLVWLYRLGWGVAEAEEDAAEDEDDNDAVVAEIVEE